MTAPSQMMDLGNTEYAFGMAPEHTFELGETTRSKADFEDYLQNTLAADYNADKYDVFFHNCNHFANDVSLYLVGKKVPQHVLDMSEQVRMHH
jgi:desumoylating isopeptidase 1